MFQSLNRWLFHKNTHNICFLDTRERNKAFAEKYLKGYIS